MSTKPSKAALPLEYRIWRGVILTLLILLGSWIIYTVAGIYIRTEINPDTTAKPAAKKILPYIKNNGGEVIHSYNRSAGGWINFVSAPSFEYYIQYDNADISRHAATLAEGLKDLGYDVQTARYTYNHTCSRYNHNGHTLPNGKSISWEKTPDEMSAHCKAITGAGERGLLGGSENNGKPYYTIYAHNNTHDVEIEITDHTFHYTSNDTWQLDFAREHKLPINGVPAGTSIAKIHLRALYESSS